MTIHPDHHDVLEKIIEDHFDQCEARVEEVNRKYFLNGSEILHRHWRNKKDIPSDLVLPFKMIWNFGAGKMLKRRVKPVPRTGKSREIERVITEDLLDLGGLERRIEAYVTPHMDRFEKSLIDTVEQVPALKREQFTRELEKYLERLNLPVEGSREAVIFLVTVAIGKAFCNQFVLSGLMGTGGLVATSLYMNQLSWFGALWVNWYAGVPGWIGYTGAAGGTVVGIVAAPLIFPFLEMAINRFRSRKILEETVQAARTDFIRPGKDRVNIAGKIAVYLQALPDVLHYAREAVKVLV